MLSINLEVKPVRISHDLARVLFLLESGIYNIVNGVVWAWLLFLVQFFIWILEVFLDTWPVYLLHYLGLTS